MITKPDVVLVLVEEVEDEMVEEVVVGESEEAEYQASVNIK